MMQYSVETTSRFDREFKQPDKYTQLMLKAWIEKNLMDCENPRQQGKALVGNKKGQWRYRIGDYRLICDIQDNKLIILAMSVGHRNKVYR